MDADPATLNQIGLIKKLAAEINVQVDFNSLDKNSTSILINELAEKKRSQGLKMVK